MLAKSALLALCLFLFLAQPVTAVVDPLSVPNNHYGIHIIDQNDLDTAASLVNSSGGTWGYVTLVIKEDDRDLAKWQVIFDRMRELQLIPIVRLATRLEGNTWAKPRIDDLEPWADFLSHLNWVVKNRYLILFNEPNHSKEWGGTIDPEGYAAIAIAYQSRLKAASDDFFVLPAGLDTSATTGKDTLDASTFYTRIHRSSPDYFTLFDGLTSHAYPNPDFSGSPTAQGRNSIRSYLWEIDLLTPWGLPSDIPIFITETGWAHNGADEDSTLLTPDQAARRFVTAFTNIWTDSRLVTITPFILNYQDQPFDSFSWTKPGGDSHHPQFAAVASLAKTAGQPVQVHQSTALSGFFPDHLLANSIYYVALGFQNTGQSIWDPNSTQLTAISSLDSNSITIEPLPRTPPFQSSKVWLRLKTPSQPGSHVITLQLQHHGQSFGQPVTFQVDVSPLTDTGAKIRSWIEQLFHPQELLVYPI